MPAPKLYTEMAFVLQTLKQRFRKKYLQLFYRNNHTGGGEGTGIPLQLSKLIWLKKYKLGKARRISFLLLQCFYPILSSADGGFVPFTFMNAKCVCLASCMFLIGDSLLSSKILYLNLILQISLTRSYRGH
jgi:hypothetical protein